MPTWTPNWNDVVIDKTGLLDAIDDCNAAIAMIEEGHGALGPFVSSAQDGWEGPARLDFDDDFGAFERQIEGVIAQLRQASVGFQREIAEANDEQARREGQRDQWRREDAEERARDAANREAAARAATEEAARAAAAAKAAAPGPGTTTTTMPQR